MPMPTHIAFLRGINVGGNNPIKMADLVTVFAALKCKEIKTIMASGNILFTPPIGSSKSLALSIQSAVAKSYKKEIGVIVRTAVDIQSLIELAPFKKLTESSTAKLYVTFLAESPATKIKAPWKSESGEVTIIRMDSSAVCWIAAPTSGRHSGDCMATLEKVIGKNVTTRSWNTILKIGKYL